MKYEYMISVESVRLADPAAFDRKDPAIVLALGMPDVAERVRATAEQVEGGGWEAVSHSLATYGNFLLISFLMRRESKCNTGGVYEARD